MSAIRKIFSFTVRTKLLLPISITIFIVLIINVIGFIYGVRQFYIESIEWRSEALAQGVLASLMVKEQREDGIGITLKNPTLEDLWGPLQLQCILLFRVNEGKEITHFAIIDDSGKILAHNDRDLLDTSLDPLLQSHLQSHAITTVLQETVYHTFVPIFNLENTYLGSVDIGFPKQTFDQKVNAFVSNIGGIFGFFLLIALLIIARIIHVIVTKPVRELVLAGQRIATGELTLQNEDDSFARFLKKKDSRDEISMLGRVFRDMLDYFQEMAHTANCIANGDLRHTIAIRSESDILGDAFYRMTGYLKEMASVATMIANGDLRRDIQPKTDRDVLGVAFQQMKSLRQSVSQVIADSTQLRAASEDLSHISIQMASNSEEASHQVHMVSITSQQITKNVNDVSTAIEALAVGLQEVSRNINEVEQIVTAAVQAATEASTTIAALESHSQEIGEIINMITMITQQTNLLALNATIEAARAGESGKGFAVVANEVKDLAREIAHSAEDVTRRVETIQSGTHDAVDAISKILSITNQVHEIATSITSTVEGQAHTADEISRNVSDAARGSDEITRSIIDVAMAVQNSSEQAVQVQNAAEVLVTLADQLQQVVETFKI